MSLLFNRSPRIHERYAVLNQCSDVPEIDKNSTSDSQSVDLHRIPPQSGTNEDGDGQTEYLAISKRGGTEYAEFMRSLVHGRAPSSQSTSSGTSAKSIGDAGDSKHSGGLSQVIQLKQKNEEQHETTIKVIEDHMWQHKQKERELKRVEGDILKRQLHLRRTMTAYTSNINDQKKQKEQNANKKIKKMEAAKQDFAISDTKDTTSKMYRNAGFENKVKEKGRKSLLTINGLEFQYKKTSESLRLKRLDIEKLTQQYETRLKKEEEEEHMLKQRLAELAISLNMEAQKFRNEEFDLQREKLSTASADVQDRNKKETELDDRLRYSMDTVLLNERNKQKLDSDLNQTIEELSSNLREEGRRLTDVRNQLRSNLKLQKYTQEAAEHAQMERRGQESAERVMLVTARREGNLNSFTRAKKRHNMKVMNDWQRRNLTKTNEAEKKNTEDSILHLQRAVKKEEDSENLLFNRVRSSESKRTKQEQRLKQTQALYEDTLRRNARLLKESAIKCQMEENEIKNKMIREQAELAKTLNEREDSVQNLVKLRHFMAHDKEMLGGEMKVYSRLNRIGDKTTSARQELVS